VARRGGARERSGAGEEKAWCPWLGGGAAHGGKDEPRPAAWQGASGAARTSRGRRCGRERVAVGARAGARIDRRRGAAAGASRGWGSRGRGEPQHGRFVAWWGAAAGGAVGASHRRGDMSAGEGAVGIERCERRSEEEDELRIKK